MWKVYSIFIILVASVCSFDKNAIMLAVEYFDYRGIKFVCLLACKDQYWTQQFVKRAIQLQIRISKVNIEGNFPNPDDLSKCLDQELTSVGVLIDSQCLGFEDVMRFASSKNSFDTNHKWLIIDESFHAEDFLNITNKNYTNDTATNVIPEALNVVETLNSSVNSDIVVGLRKGFFDYDLYEAFNFGKIQGGNVTIEHIGSWDNDTGLVLSKDLNRYKYYDRWDFKQWPMRMIVVYSNPPKHFDPEMIIGRTPAPGIAVITQTTATILNVIAEIHNFRYIYTMGERWIGPYEPENTSIVTSALYYGHDDISPIIRMSSFVMEKIDIVHPALTSIETRYYYRIPTYGAGKFENQFFRPLSTDAWLCVVAVTILCAAALLFSAKLEQRPKPAQYAVFSVFASFCQQFFDDSGDNTTRRRSQARRISVFVTGLSCVLIYNYYTSSVVSWLLNGPPPSITSLEELLESPLQLIFEDIGYARSWIQSPGYYYNKKNAKVEDEMRKRKVFNKKKDGPLLLSAEEGIKMVKAGGYAFHTEVDTANMLISRKFNQVELCELGSLQSMEKTLLYPVIQKNSPYKEFLVWSLARLSERGIVSCVQRRTRSNPVYCEGSSPRALALGGAAPAFLLLAFGYLLATVILLLERLASRWTCKGADVIGRIKRAKRMN